MPHPAKRLGTDSAVHRSLDRNCGRSGKVRPSGMLYNTQLEWPNPLQPSSLTPGVP